MGETLLEQSTKQLKNWERTWLCQMDYKGLHYEKVETSETQQWAMERNFSPIPFLQDELRYKFLIFNETHPYTKVILESFSWDTD